MAFEDCVALTDVECGMLEIIRKYVFAGCISLRSINVPSVRIVERGAFGNCNVMTDAKFGNKLESLGVRTFCHCTSLERITIPFKEGLFTADDIFVACRNLFHVDLVEGEVHETIAALQLEEWRNDMNEEIDFINQILPDARAGYYNGNDDYVGEKAWEIRAWIRSVLQKIFHYKAEHQRLLNEAATLLEMAMWKAALDDNNGGRIVSEGFRTTRGSVKRVRREVCVTSGASIVIKNVLPFLELKS